MKKKVINEQICQKGISKIKYIAERCWREEMSSLPGNLAFFTILSLVPIFTLMSYGTAIFNLSVESIEILLQNSLSPDIAKMVAPIAGDFTINTSTLIIIIIMFYIASNGPSSIIIASDIVYNIPLNSWIKRRLKALFMTTILILIYISILLIPEIGMLIVNALDLHTLWSYLIILFKWPMLLFITFTFLKVVYTIAPDGKVPSKYMNIGAGFTTIGWIITTIVYRIYLSSFAEYDLYYAGLSNIAILMLWIYLLSIIFVIGMNINYQVYENANKRIT